MVNREGKLTPNAVQCVMVCYDLDHKVYRLYHPSSNKISVATNVVFDEILFPLSNISVNDEANGQNNRSLSRNSSDRNTPLLPSSSNEFSGLDESFSSSTTNGLNVLSITQYTTSGELQSNNNSDMSLDQATNPNSTGSFSPLAQTHFFISMNSTESSTVTSAHPPQSDYVPITSYQDDVDRSPIQTRSKMADSILI